MSKFDQAEFFICFSFCVTRLRTWQKRGLRRVDRQSRAGLIYILFDLVFQYYAKRDSLRWLVSVFCVAFELPPKVSFHRRGEAGSNDRKEGQSMKITESSS